MEQKLNLKNYKSSENERLRKSKEFKLWREAVFLRDNFTCQRCGNKEDLHPHHLKSFAKYPDLRFEINNGQTLCSKCHGKIHGLKYNKLGRYLTCEICHKKFRPKGGHLKQRTCSKDCGYKLRTKNGSKKKGKKYPHLQRSEIKICPICKNKFRAKNDTYKRKQKYCSRNCWNNRKID